MRQVGTVAIHLIPMIIWRCAVEDRPKPAVVDLWCLISATPAKPSIHIRLISMDSVPLYLSPRLLISDFVHPNPQRLNSGRHGSFQVVPLVGYHIENAQLTWESR